MNIRDSDLDDGEKGQQENAPKTGNLDIHNFDEGFFGNLKKKW